MAQMLEVISGPLEGRTHTLEEGMSISIGRSSQNDITLPYDPWISSAHATIKNKNDSVYMMDLHSSNGSYIKGKKISPNIFEPIEEFLIIGSTLCRVGDAAENNLRPLSVKKANAESYLENSLVRGALKLAKERRSPTLGTVHLFMAILDLENPEVDRFIKSLKLDPQRLYRKLDKLQVYEGSRQWINDFLIYQYKTKERTDCFLTPLVRRLITDQDNERGNPIPLLKSMLNGSYNLLQPLLGIDPRKSGSSMPGFTEKVTLNPYDGADDKIILPKRFWKDLTNAMEQNRTILLSGGKGTGKTAILKQCFHALPKVDVDQFHTSEKRIFDPEIFLVFNELTDLVPYVNKMIRLLRTNHLIAIDHFGFLIDLMDSLNIDPKPLIGSLARRGAPTFLGVRSEHLKTIEKRFKSPIIIKMDDYLTNVTRDILHNFMTEFETEVKVAISPKASDYLMGELPTHYNLAAIKAFFEFCAEKVRNLNFLYRDLSIEGNQKQKALSQAFFQAALDHWASPFRPGGVQRHPGITSQNKAVKSTPAPGKNSGNINTFALRTEDLLKHYAREFFRTELVFSDGTNSIMDEGELDQEDKFGELTMQMESILTSFETGFLLWVETFLKEHGPEEAEATGSTPEVLWKEHVYQMSQIDQAYLRKQFLDITRKTLRRKLQDWHTSY